MGKASGNESVKNALAKEEVSRYFRNRDSKQPKWRMIVFALQQTRSPRIVGERDRRVVKVLLLAKGSDFAGPYNSRACDTHDKSG
jgi:hypothetical protein